jgi:beta-glucosidase-like glycosyl hydrolase
MKELLDYTNVKSLLTPLEKIGQLFMPAAFINDSEKEIQKLENLIIKYGVGSLCFFHSRASAATNYEGKKEVIYNSESFQVLKKLIKRYQNVSKHPLLIAIDAEWGLAMRIENTPQYPYAITLGAIQESVILIYDVGLNIAKDCRAAGIHWNLSPCVDINNNPNNPVIGYRSFGENKFEVTEKALAFIKGTQSEGILTSIKHFPGHGDTATDSHLGLPIIEKSKEELLDNELYPFQKIIKKGVDSVMVGHLSVPALSNGKTTTSSISKDMIKGILRDEMGFTGVVISDALNMHAVSKNYPIKGELEWLAFDAGNDILCFAEHVSEGIALIHKNASEEQLEESFRRVWKLKKKAIEAQKLNTNAKLVNPNFLNRKIAENSLTLLKGTDEDIASFRETNFCTLTVKRSLHGYDTEEILNSLEVSKSEIKKEKNILILLTPPQVKPVNNFGLLQEELDFMSKLMNTKNVVLYIFGNPYVLNHLNIKHAKAVVVVYQNLKEFQDVATQHFLGKIKAIGKLPVTIN